MVLILTALTCKGAVTGGGGGGGGLPITDPWLVLDEPTLAKPASLAPMFPGPFNLKVTRIVGDPGTTITFSGGSGAAGAGARRHYCDDQPWYMDGTHLNPLKSGSP